MKNNIKKVRYGIVLISVMVCLSGCCLRHEWQDATCTSPRTCIKCGETEGEALGHEWQDATCTSPQICIKCGETEGEALGHEWQDATCTSPQICIKCGEIEGEALKHNLSSGGFCVYCGAQFGEEITKASFKDYFEVTCSDSRVSPFTITIKPKSSRYTYGGVETHSNPKVRIYVNCLVTSTDVTSINKTKRTDIVSSENATIYLDSYGRGSYTYNWSQKRATSVSFSIQDVENLYCYPKQ